MTADPIGQFGALVFDGVARTGVGRSLSRNPFAGLRGTVSSSPGVVRAFTGSSPFGDLVLLGATANLYSHTAGNPANLVDPDGEWVLPAIIIIGSGAAVYFALDAFFDGASSCPAACDTRLNQTCDERGFGPEERESFLDSNLQDCIDLCVSNGVGAISSIGGSRPSSGVNNIGTAVGPDNDNRIRGTQ